MCAQRQQAACTTWMLRFNQQLQWHGWRVYSVNIPALTPKHTSIYRTGGEDAPWQKNMFPFFKRRKLSQRHGDKVPDLDHEAPWPRFWDPRPLQQWQQKAAWKAPRLANQKRETEQCLKTGPTHKQQVSPLVGFPDVRFLLSVHEGVHGAAFRLGGESLSFRAHPRGRSPRLGQVPVFTEQMLDTSPAGFGYVGAAAFDPRRRPARLRQVPVVADRGGQDAFVTVRNVSAFAFDSRRRAPRGRRRRCLGAEDHVHRAFVLDGRIFSLAFHSRPRTRGTVSRIGALVQELPHWAAVLFVIIRPVWHHPRRRPSWTVSPIGVDIHDSRYCPVSGFVGYVLALALDFSHGLRRLVPVVRAGVQNAAHFPVEVAFTKLLRFRSALRGSRRIVKTVVIHFEDLVHGALVPLCQFPGRLPV